MNTRFCLDNFINLEEVSCLKTQMEVYPNTYPSSGESLNLVYALHICPTILYSYYSLVFAWFAKWRQNCVTGRLCTATLKDALRVQSTKIAWVFQVNIVLSLFLWLIVSLFRHFCKTVQQNEGELFL